MRSRRIPSSEFRVHDSLVPLPIDPLHRRHRRPRSPHRARSSSPHSQAPARRRACRRRWSTTGRSSCCSRAASRRGRLRSGSRTSAAGRSAARSAGRSGSSAASRADTRLLVATEGMLTARLQQRSAALRFPHHRPRRVSRAQHSRRPRRSRWRSRRGARATTCASSSCPRRSTRRRCPAFLDGCPVVDVPGRLHPLEISYAPERIRRRARRRRCWLTRRGDVLCFLPGAAEIRRAIAELRPRVDARRVEVLPLHGVARRGRRRIAALQARPTAARRDRRRDQHRRDVADGSRRDGGRRLRAAQGRALRCRRARIDSLDHRAHYRGRGGSARRPRRRAAPGHGPPVVGCARSAAAAPRARDSPRRPVRRAARHRRVGRRPATIEWFERPRAEATRCGAGAARPPRRGARGHADRSRTCRSVRLPLHPRLARMLLAAGGARVDGAACALLSERHVAAVENGCRDQLRSAVGARRLGRPAAARPPRRARDRSASTSP